METLPLWVQIVGLIATVVVLALAGRRALWLYRLISSGTPDPARIKGVTKRVGEAIKGQLVEVLGQRKLLKWSVPGIAHAFVMYAFLILGTVYVEAYGVLISRNPKWSFGPLNAWGPLGFLQDLIAVLCLVGLATFTYIRFKNAPEKLGRKSRFKGSHLSGAWITLFMIFNVIWTLFLFRAASSALGNLGYGKAAFASYGLGQLLKPLGEGPLHLLESIGLLLHIGIMLVFLIFVLNSKHLHIFIAPINVMFKRQPVALGAAKPLMAAGKPVTLDDIEEMDEETALGVGSIQDFSWKGLLDMATCTECGRCQSQCPAWNTEKPLSPKMLIMNLRDHAFASAPYLIGDGSGASAAATAEHERPLVGETEGEPWHPTGGGVIDPDVLWSCVTCGACVQQCPVDIEHVDHIVDMRRYQVLVESNFPAELNQLFKGLEGRGNPWNMSPTARLDWTKGLPFDVKVVGEDVESLDEVDWLFWVGCAGAYEDRAKKTTQAVAELLTMAGVNFAVLGNGETCTGDSARRAGNEFVFQGLAQHNIETFKEYKVKKVVSTCAHCFNTLKNEYKQLGYELDVVHHTQLLNRLVREKKLTPVASGGGTRSITYHDPCYLGRHNQVYSPPRELLQVLPGAEFKEMPRNSERSFCCGAGGARMWMEETIGTRINDNRTLEAVETGADQIAVGCPFCRVMLADGLTSAQSTGKARAEVEVLDVAQLLLASVKGETTAKASSAPTPAEAPAAAAAAAAASTTVAEPKVPSAEPFGGGRVETTGGSLFDTPEPADESKAPSGGSLFDTPEPKPSSGSLFDTPESKSPSGSLFDTPESKSPSVEPTSGGGRVETMGASLFDTPEPADESKALSGGSLFDIAEPDGPAVGEPVDASIDSVPELKAAAAESTEPVTGFTPATVIPEGGSLFDVAEPTASAEPATSAEPAAPVEPAAAADSEPAAAPQETASTATSAKSDSTPDHAPITDKKIEGLGSLFDL